MRETFSEARAFPRASSARLCRFALQGGRHVHGRTINLALRGAALELPEPLEAGTAGTLTLSIDGALIDIEARIVRIAACDGRYEAAMALGKTSREYVHALASVFADAMG